VVAALEGVGETDTGASVDGGADGVAVPAAGAGVGAVVATAAGVTGAAVDDAGAGGIDGAAGVPAHAVRSPPTAIIATTRRALTGDTFDPFC
jgi:hypothetical protein